MLYDVTFSVNSYDPDGDIYEKGVYLHFGNTRIHIGRSLEDLKNFRSQVDIIINEITENYSDI